MYDEKDILYLIIDTINNLGSIDNIEPRIKKIGDFITDRILNEKLLPKEFLYSFLLFKKSNYSNNYFNPLLEKKDKFKEYLNKQKIFTVLDNIFLIDILSGNFEEGFRNYLKNILIYDFHEGINYEYTKILPQLCHEFLKYNPKIVFDCITDIFKNFFNFKKKERRSILNWVWQCLWASQIILQKRKEVFKIYPLLKDILYKLIDMKKIDEAMIFSMFIYNIVQNVMEEQKKDYKMLQDEISSPCIELYKEWLIKHSNQIKPITKSRNNKKKKIAFIRPNIGYWSPFIVEFSLMKSLKNNKEFNKLYNFDFCSFTNLELWCGKGNQKKCVDMLKEIDVNLISPVEYLDIKEGYYVNNLKKVLKFREYLVKNNYDIIIFCGDLYFIGEFLFLSRTAPIQIYWSHGNFWANVNGIDKRIVHFNDPNRLEGNPYKWEFFDVPIDRELLNPEEEKYKKEAEKIRKRFPEGTVILGSIGRLTKINNWDYLKAVAEILKANPETVYLACGPGDIEEIREKIIKLGIEDRFYFEGFVNPHVYSYVIDVYLNTFPEPSGYALEEFIAKGDNKFVVSLS